MKVGDRGARRADVEAAILLSFRLGVYEIGLLVEPCDVWRSEACAGVN